MNYLNEEQIIDISKVVNLDYEFFAHKKELNNKMIYENLIYHIGLSNKYFLNICNEKNIYEIFKKFEDIYLEDVSEEGKLIFRELLINIVNFHDIGKINPRFQLDKMENKLFNYDEFKSVGSKHSIISAVIYIDYFWNRMDSLDRKNKSRLREFLFLNAYLISKHHGDLDSYESFIDSFKVIDGNDGDGYRAINVLAKYYKEVYKKEFNITIEDARKGASIVLKKIKSRTSEEAMYLYTYERLVFSLLLAADFYSTSEFMNEITIDNFGDINDINEFYDVYKETDIYKKIREYEKNEYARKHDFSNENNINVLRTEMFLDSENVMKNNLDGEIFYLEAPTGAGKSNIATNLSFRLIKHKEKLKKIFWVYPFNTLVEQNKENLKKIYENKDEVLRKIATINSVTPIKIDKNIVESDEEFTDMEKYKEYAYALLNRQFLNYPMTLITHVGIFDSMFGRNKKDIFSFHQLANSVIVFDEIQSYKLQIWTEIISFLKVFSKLMNIKIIIMSATLPNLDILTNIKGNTVTLIENRDKYFTNPLFKDRVKVDYSLIDKSRDEIVNHIKENSNNNKKILVEFIKKSTAYEVYDELINTELGCEVLLLTGDDNQIDRSKMLEIIKSKKSCEEGVILIATQVIEAGVDIDMDIGYKDISRLDGEEQFMGRINRSCLRDGIVYFFNIDNEKSIYRKDIRAESRYTLKNQWVKDVLINKNFSVYYNEIMKELAKEYNESTNSKYSIEEFFEEIVAGLDFYKISERMRLIDDDNRTVSVFLARTIEDEAGNIIDGVKVWNKYIELLKDKKLQYAEREVKLSEIRANMSYFIYEVKEINVSYDDAIGELYYIEDGEKYFKNNKIDKEKIITGIGDFI